MKAVSTAAAILAIAASAAAQGYTQSKPFYLVAHTHDAKYNGSAFGACHEGAGIEGLCPGVAIGNSSVTYSTFQFNTSVYEANQTYAHGAPGIVTFELRGGNFNESEPLSLAYNPTSNVAVPLFIPTTGTQMAFDSHNRLNIQTNIDDTKGAPQLVQPAEAFYRWYICQTYYGYNYTTLAWVSGKYPPENPTCVKTEVVRVFV